MAPPSRDLAAALFRARLFEVEGFGIWNDFWYAGHTLPGYSVLAPAVAATVGPQLSAAIAVVGATVPFTALAVRHRGRDGLPGATLFGVLVAVSLLTGRLTFALGLLPGATAVWALDLGWWPLAAGCAVVASLLSPVAGLGVAIVAAGYALAGTRRAAGAATCAAAVLPIGLLALAFGGSGVEPFQWTSMAPVLAVALLGAVVAGPTLRSVLLIYGVAVLACFLAPSPVGDNVARMGTLLAAPVAMVVLWDRRPRPLAVAIVPLLYIGLQGPVADVVAASGSPETHAGFYRPLVGWLAERTGPPFRVEIPFTALHWESWYVATRFPLARGWERQLDEADDPLFYRRGALTAASYDAWLHDEAVRFVAVPDAPLDPAGVREAALVRGGLPYLSAPVRVGAWRVYAVRHPTPIAAGAATLTALGPDRMTLVFDRAGASLVRVRWSPYWSVAGGAGCVARTGAWLRVTAPRAETVRLRTRFALGRIGAGSPTCAHGG